MTSGYVNAVDRKKVVEFAEIAIKHFSESDWVTLGVRTGCLDYVQTHARLLRSLSWHDPDYNGCAHEVMLHIVEREHANLALISDLVAQRFGPPGENVSTVKPTVRHIVFNPSVFEIPDSHVETDLVAVMMPFAPHFEPVFQAINAACSAHALRCQRAKDIWDSEIIIQDVFSLIFRSQLVVCDFTGRNANVFYEAGIAHTLGKTVIPITQSRGDIPFDVQHHRYIEYLDNDEGRRKLVNDLRFRLNSIAPPNWSVGQS